MDYLRPRFLSRFGLPILISCALTIVLGGKVLAAPLAPEVVGSYLSRSGGHVLVVAAGNWERTHLAALAVEQAIIDSGRAETIESGASLGDIQGLSDTEILDRLSRKRLDEIVVVRMFPEAPNIANVRFYDPNGLVLSEFQYGPELAVLPRVQTPAPPVSGLEDLSAELSRAQSASEYDEEPLAMQRSRLFFSKAHLDVRDVRMISWAQRRGRWRSSSKLVMVATQGNAEDLVPWDLFYELVNRPDLLLLYHQRQLTNYKLLLIGGFFAAAAVPLLITAGATSTQSDKQIPYSLAGVGSGLMLSGIIQMLIGGFRSPHPVDRAALEQLAQVHNSQLPQPAPSPIEQTEAVAPGAY